MNSKIFSFLFFLILMPMTGSFANKSVRDEAAIESPQDKKGSNNSIKSSKTEDEIRMLRRLLDMPPVRLRMLRRTIERLENYSEEEREKMKKKLNKLRSMEPGDRNYAMEVLLKRHASLKSYWASFSPENRAVEIRKFISMSNKQRKKFVEELPSYADLNTTKPFFQGP